MNSERFQAWRLVRLRGYSGPYSGSAWRVAAHIYRDRAINCMHGMRQYQADMRTWEQAYTELEAELEAARKALEEIRHRTSAPHGRLLSEIFAEYDTATKGSA